MLADVAAGRLGGYMAPHMHPWDALAGLLLITEAGGRIAPFPGDGTGGLVMGCAPGLWEDLSAMAALATGKAIPAA
jgi:myo-inositol-1(or 4)-monophosphatase